MVSTTDKFYWLQLIYHFTMNRSTNEQRLHIAELYLCCMENVFRKFYLFYPTCCDQISPQKLIHRPTSMQRGSTQENIPAAFINSNEAHNMLILRWFQQLSLCYLPPGRFYVRCSVRAMKIADDAKTEAW